jgi:hypothetical protein
MGTSLGCVSGERGDAWACTGKDFEPGLALIPGSVRVEVTDTRTGSHPPGPGLLLVDASAARWKVLDRDPPPGRTVRAEVDVTGWLGIVQRVGA